jgi:hypothetical protein
MQVKNLEKYDVSPKFALAALVSNCYDASIGLILDAFFLNNAKKATGYNCPLLTARYAITARILPHRT